MIFAICKNISYVLFITILILFTSTQEPIVKNNIEVNILISEDSSATKIAQILFEKKIISSRKAFITLYHILNKMFHVKLKTGEYIFRVNEGLISAFWKISKGDSLIRKLTVVEGTTVTNILKLLNDNPYLKGAIKSIPQEGSLFPSTYFYSYGTEREDLIAQMSNKMSQILSLLSKSLNQDSPIKTTEDLVILASIIEKEAKYDIDKEQIAAILIKRLNIGMKLQVDASLMYFLTEGRFDRTANLTFKDLKIDSKFNSYQYFGLPPTAISCPGIKSLEAIINTKDTDFLYFLSTQNGKIIYNKNLSDHVKSKKLKKIKLKK